MKRVGREAGSLRLVAYKPWENKASLCLVTRVYLRVCNTHHGASLMVYLRVCNTHQGASLWVYLRVCNTHQGASLGVPRVYIPTRVSL